MWPKNAHLIHGDNRIGKRTAEYRAWAAMKDRCSNPKTKGYHRYGGRSIKVCEQWKNSYATFLADMGRRPTQAHSLERINNNGNYSWLNCRWTTRQEQACNRVYKLTNGDIKAIRSMARVTPQKSLALTFGVDPSTISRVVTRKRHAYAA